MDGTKCHGIGCPLRGSCKRYNEPSTERQAYFTIAPIRDGRCEYYMHEPAPETTLESEEYGVCTRSAVHVSWVHNQPFRMTNGEMYTGEWVYHPSTLANGGPDAQGCE